MHRSVTKSKPIHVVSPRITLMVAIDSYGDTYWSLIQANSANWTMELVLINLIKTLD